MCKLSVKHRNLSTQPLIIIGAGRSGTNMLRDVLTRLDTFSTWPCDEINYIWRYGNRDYHTDEFTDNQATHEVKGYIRQQFEKMGRDISWPSTVLKKVLIEKTCANSLRVGFVDAVVPEAKYIFLVRDGRDVVSSASKRWKAPLDIPYLAAKARYVPKADLLYYAYKYLGTRVAKIRDGKAQLSIWGPKFEDWRAKVEEHSLIEVCAYQWARCVMLSAEAFSSFSADRVYLLRYEDFVDNPTCHIQNIVKFIGSSEPLAAIEHACQGVSRSSVGQTDIEISAECMDILAPALKRFGYTE